MSEENQTTEERGSLVSRLLPMVILVVCFMVAESVLYLVVLIQLIWTAISRTPNKNITGFSASLAKWLQETARYLTFVTEEKPFPWGSWPKQDSE
ncbi:MAG TPA: DUF4389 domain-containing protein [Paracoccaceae bacterium]|nr:DUF4389 domain-containing protein [Paracoccaceae bacterium]